MKILVKELFDDPYPLRWADQNTRAYFEVDLDGKKAEIQVYYAEMHFQDAPHSSDIDHIKEIATRYYEDRLPETFVEIIFSTYLDGDSLGTEDVLGAFGNKTVKVFSTILAATEEYFQTTPPDVVSFSAKINHPTRVKLYNTFARTLPSRYNFTKISDEGRDKAFGSVYYVFVRN